MKNTTGIRLSGATLALGALIASGAAGAQAINYLPYDAAAGGTNDGIQNPSSAGTYTSGTETLSLNYAGGVGEVSTTGSASGGYNFNTATLEYFFEVLDPSNTISTSLVNIALTGSTSSSGDASASAFVMSSTGDLLLNLCAASGVNAAYCTLSSSFSGSVQFTAPTNTVEQITLSTSGYASPSGSWSASIDPSLSLDGSNPPGLSLAFSPDLPGSVIGPPTNLPEVDSLAALSLGLAAALVLRRRRAR